jgi:cyclopropane-fatty-acyl-phospholipid synthase
MDVWWDGNDLDSFFCSILKSEIRKKRDSKTVLSVIKAKLTNQQSRTRSKKVTEVHYDLSNDFFKDMLDPNMQYSCAYFKDTEDLAKAQEQKMQLIAKKLQIKKGETVLDIGGGWGGLAKFLAKEYGCNVTMYTLSKEQAAYAKNFTKGLAVTVEHKDYRDIEGKYDKIVSVGMFEHVGSKNYRDYMKIVFTHLKEGGLFLLHTIGKNTTTKAGRGEPWMGKYIFPHGELPSLARIMKAAEIFVVEDIHSFGPYYDKTLMAWHENFLASWEKHCHLGNRFKRMWEYYLLSCAGSFRARSIQLWQVVLAKRPSTHYERPESVFN